MTPEELDDARAAEAFRQTPDTCSNVDVVRCAARLAREGWQPPETVDPDAAAFLEWEKQQGEAGRDKRDTYAAYLAGCTRGREGAKGLVEAVENLISISAGPYSYPDLRAALASAKRGG